MLFRSILQANWTWQKLAVNLRETIYGPTSQYTATANPVLLKMGVTGITDIDVSYALTHYLKVSVGANNLFNVIPPLIPNGANGKPVDGGRVFGVPVGFSPYGQDGGYFYGRVTVTF